MAPTESMMDTRTAKRAKGGSFLIEVCDPQDVFTPEDFSEEQRQIAKTATEFAANEAMPVAEEIDFRLTKGLLRKAGELGLMAVDMLRTQMAIVRLLAKHDPADTIAIGRHIAQHVLAAGQYSI